MAGHPPPRSNGDASPPQRSARDRGEGLRGVGRVPGVHRLRLFGFFGGPGSGRPRQLRGRAVQVGERALALGTAPHQPGVGHGRARVGRTGAGWPARAGPTRACLARSGLARTQGASTQAASRTSGLSFGARWEDATWRNLPFLSGAGGVHPWQFADGLLGRPPGRMTGRPGSAHRVQPVRGAERLHRRCRGVARPARGRPVCVCAAAHRGVRARGTARRAMAA
jgi:hypothetical protein